MNVIVPAILSVADSVVSHVYSLGLAQLALLVRDVVCDLVFGLHGVAAMK